MELIKVKRLLDEFKAMEAWEHWRYHCVHHHEEYYRMGGRILTALGYYKDALLMYRTGLERCRTREQQIEYKANTHREIAEINRILSLTHEISVSLLYESGSEYVFMDEETFEEYNADEEAVKYAKTLLVEGQSYVLIVDSFKKVINVQQKING